MPVVFLIFSTLILILLVDKFLKNLALSIALGAWGFCLALGYSWKAITTVTLEVFQQHDYWRLLITIFLLMGFSRFIQATNLMRDLMAKLQHSMSNRMTMALGPTIIGMVPMPGGALFSAPLLKECAGSENLSPDLKTRINYWFRHVWEYWFPIYPGIFLALQITGVSIVQLAFLGIPITVFSFFLGYFLFLRKIPLESTGKKDHLQYNVAYYLLPIIVLVLLFLILSLMTNMNSGFSLIIAIAISFLVAYIQRPLSKEHKWKTIFINKTSLEMLTIITSVSLFSLVIKGETISGLPIMEQVHYELEQYGVPLIGIIVLLPFMSGLATGIAIGFVGTSFPIIFSLLPPDIGSGSFSAVLVFSYVCGHMGQMLSPIHTCNVVTNQYFDSKLGKNTIYLIFPAVIMILFSAVYAWILSQF